MNDEKQGLAGLAEVVAVLAREGAKEVHCPAGERFEFAGRMWLAKQAGQVVEVKPPEPKRLQNLKVSTPEDICSFAKSFCDPAHAVIRVGSSGILLDESAFQEEGYTPGRVHAPFFNDDCPPKAVMNYVELLNWLDRFPGQIGTGLDELGQVTDITPHIRSVFSSISAHTTGTVAFKEEGGVINISVKEEGGVVASGVVPRYVAVFQRFGSPNFKTGVLYNIKIAKNREEGLVVQVIQVPTDGAYDRWVQWAIPAIKSALNKDGASWVVTQAP